MRHAAPILALTLGLLAARPPVALAAGWQLGEQSATAGGTGGAGTARAGRASAAWYNPAALADGRGLRLAAGMLLAASSITATAEDGSWSERTNGGLKTPPHLYGSYAVGPFAAGLAANVPFGSGVSWPEGWPGRFDSVLTSITVYRLAPFVAWRLGPLRLAAGPQIDLAQMRSERRLDFVDTEGLVAVDLRGAGAGAHGSLFVELLGGDLALGVSYRSRSRLSLEGDARFDVPDSFTARASDQRASTTLTLPDLLAFGVGYTAPTRWPLTALLDVGVALWTTLDHFTVDFVNEATTDSERAMRWRSRPWVRGGISLRPHERLTLRAGMLYDPTPVPDETLAPTSPDSSRLGGTVGAGLRLVGGLRLDVYYGLVALLGNAASDPERLRSRYDGRIHLLGFGLRHEPR